MMLGVAEAAKSRDARAACRSTVLLGVDLGIFFPLFFLKTSRGCVLKKKQPT